MLFPLEKPVVEVPVNWFPFTDEVNRVYNDIAGKLPDVIRSQEICLEYLRWTDVHNIGLLTVLSANQNKDIMDQGVENGMKYVIVRMMQTIGPLPFRYFIRHSVPEFYSVALSILNKRTCFINRSDIEMYFDAVNNDQLAFVRPSVLMEIIIEFAFRMSPTQYREYAEDMHVHIAKVHPILLQDNWQALWKNLLDVTTFTTTIH